MGLEPGSKLCSYEILSSLGTGGMDEVYRAKDMKLGRELAEKFARMLDSPRRLVLEVVPENYITFDSHKMMRRVESTPDVAGRRLLTPVDTQLVAGARSTPFPRID